MTFYCHTLPGVLTDSVPNPYSVPRQCAYRVPGKKEKNKKALSFKWSLVNNRDESSDAFNNVLNINEREKKNERYHWRN